MEKRNTPLEKPAVRLAGVIGWPVAHSLSPLIHRIWAAREGANAHYIPIPVADTYKAFKRAVEALALIGFAGVNVTIPHKDHALKFCRKATHAATMAGAANMIRFTDDGPVADNSDIDGFARAFADAAPQTKSGRALVLGAGGAARGVILGLKNLGFEDILIANRTAIRAEKLVKDLKGSARTISWEHFGEALASIDVLVNATSLGMTGQPPLAIAIDQLRHETIVCDIVYSPLATPFLIAAGERGHKCVDGLSMLMHQAVPGYKAWLGREAVVDDDLRTRLVSALEKRGAS